MLLELKNINYEIDGKKILNNVNLEIELNKFIVITGPNGSGKSTLAKIIAGILTQTSGEILLNGVDISDFSIDQRANLGLSFAFQQPVKFKGLTVLDLLSISAGRYASFEKCIDILEKVGLPADEYLHRELDSTLSGGELKRIEIASVILRESEVTIFDEPEAGIDLWSFNELIDLFKSIRKEKHGSTIIISHQEKIIKIADEVILLKKGKVSEFDKALINS